MKRAHDILSHPARKAQYLFRTERCKYGIGCPHGVKCERAHDPQQIRHVDCLYEDYCFKTSPHHPGESCYFYHPKDGAREIWLKRVSQPDFHEKACRVCPTVLANKTCADPYCPYAHSLDQLKFPGRCPLPRKACRPDCLLRHRMESREAYVQAVDRVSSAVFDVIEQKEEDPDDQEVKWIITSSSSTSSSCSSPPSLPPRPLSSVSNSPGAVKPMMSLSDLKEMREHLVRQLATIDSAIQAKLSVLCVSPGAPVLQK